MPDTLEIEALEGLGSLTEKGKPVDSRIKDVKSAISIFNTLRKADEGSSTNRARVDAMFDGANPYDSRKLATSGQGLKTNLNFGEAQRLLDIALSAYVDLYSSLEKLVEVCSYNVARTFGLYPQKGTLRPGADADLVIIDLNKEQTVTPELAHTAAGYTLFDGRKLKGWPVLTMVRGKVVMRDGQITAEPGYGQYVARYVKK